MAVDIKIQVQGDEEALKVFDRLNDAEKQRKAAFDAANRSFATQNKSINDLNADLKRLSEARDKAFDVKEIAKLNREIAGTTKKLEELKNKGVKPAGDALNNMANIAKKVGVAMIAAFAGEKIIEFGKKIFETTATFQKFEAVLTNTLGSKSEAQKSLQQINEFAASTPFGVEELTESFVKLANSGFKPTTEEMRKLGDLASATGKSFDMLVEGLLDANSGEFERLKEFGIKADATGEKIKFTFKGVTSSVEKNGDAIQKYVLSLGDLKGVAGGMEAISKTLGGGLSNLEDSIGQLYQAIGGQLAGAFSDVIGYASTFVGFLKEMATTSAPDKLKEEQTELNILTDALKNNNITSEEKSLLISEISAKYPEFIKTIDLNTASEKDLAIAVGKANREYDKRILVSATGDIKKKYEKEGQELLTELVNIQKRIATIKSGTETNFLGQKIAYDVPYETRRLKEQYDAITIQRNSLAKKQNDEIREYEKALGLNSDEEVSKSKDAERAQAAKDLAEKEAKAKKAEMDKAAAELAKLQEKAAKEAAEKAKKAREKAEKEAAEFAFREFQAQKVAEIEKQKNALEYAKEQLANAKTSDDEKELLTAEIGQREIDLIKLQNQQKLDVFELNDKNQIVRKKLTNTEIENLTRESGEAVRKIEAENIIRLEELKNKNVAKVLKNNFDASVVEAEENLRVQISENAQKTISAKTLKELKTLQDARKTLIEQGEITETNLKIAYVEKQLSTLVLNTEEKKKLEKELFDFRSSIAEKEVKLTEEKLARELKAEEDAKKKKQEIIDASVGLGKAVVDFAFAYEKQANDNALTELNARKEQELLSAGDSAQRREAINKKFAAEEAKVKTKQAKEDKIKALFDIAINTAVAVVKAAPNPILMGIAAVVGGLSAALVASKPIPKFKSGVEMLVGPGNETSDSIHAMLSRGERVVSAKTNREFYPTLSAIHNGKISAKSLNDFVLNGMKTVVIDNQNNTKLVQSVENLTNTLAKQPKAEISIDKQGFSVFLSDSMQREQQLNDRYSF